MPLGSEARAQVLERLGTADLLHAEHIGGELADHSRQLGQLGVVGPLAGGPRLARRAEEVLEVPRADDHDMATLRLPREASLQTQIPE